MIKIGEFSKLVQVPVATLRYYDQLGLLKPIEVDRFTGYRYYSGSQLPQLHRILALKGLGFSLEQIRVVLEEGLTLEQMRGMLRLRHAQISEQLSEMQSQLGEVEARLHQIEREEQLSTYDVILKQVEPLLVAFVRTILPSHNAVGALFSECYEALRCRVPDSGRMQVQELPAATMAATIHHGSYNTIGEVHEAVLKWIETNGYRIVGPDREIYLYNTQPISRDDESYVTEIQYPAEKAT